MTKAASYRHRGGKRPLLLSPKRLAGNFRGHLRTVIRHRHMVMRHCIKAGIPVQGLLHDLSKFTPTEFIKGVIYYQGTRSPNEGEREAYGCSYAWMHHKGRNRHHFEYWTDINPVTRVYEPVEMPPRYLCEMVIDRIAACKTYQGSAYTDRAPLEYLERARESELLNSVTMRRLHAILTMLAEKGEEETFRFMREVVLKGLPYADTDAPDT